MINNGFKIGDYVIADRAEFDTFDDTTFKIVSFGVSLYGNTLANVVNIARPNGHPTSFYLRELSLEDGSLPVLDAPATPEDHAAYTAHAAKGEGAAAHDAIVSCYTSNTPDGPEDVHETRFSDGSCRCGHYSARKA